MVVVLTVLSPTGLTTSYTGSADGSAAAVSCALPAAKKTTTTKQVGRQITIPSDLLNNCCKMGAMTFRTELARIQCVDIQAEFDRHIGVLG